MVNDCGRFAARGGNCYDLLMNKLPETVKQVLDILSAQFGTTGAYLWTAYVHYVCVYALVCMLSGVGGTYAVIKSAQYYIVADAVDDKDTQQICHAIRGVVTTVGIIIITCFVGDNLTDVVYPTGAALTYIVQMIAHH